VAVLLFVFVEIAKDCEGVGCEIRHYFPLKKRERIIFSAAFLTPS
jgi:hypothetical protein